MKSINNRTHDFSFETMNAKDMRKSLKYLYPKPSFKFKWLLFIFLAVLVIFLDVYAWLFADRTIFWLTLIAGFAIGAFLSIPSVYTGYSKQPFLKTLARIAIIVCVFVSFPGVFAVSSPKYRALVVEEKITRQEEKIAKQVERSKRIATERHVASIIAAIQLPEECSSEYRTGKMLIVLDGYQPSSSTDDFDLDESVVTRNISDASTIVWIISTSAKVGEYHNPASFDVKTGDALVITWKVWLIDLKSRTIIAYKSFNGPNPPKTIDVGGDYGESPLHFVEEWLNNMPEKTN